MRRWRTWRLAWGWAVGSSVHAGVSSESSSSSSDSSSGGLRGFVLPVAHVLAADTDTGSSASDRFQSASASGSAGLGAQSAAFANSTTDDGDLVTWLCVGGAAFMLGLAILLIVYCIYRGPTDASSRIGDLEAPPPSISDHLHQLQRRRLRAAGKGLTLQDEAAMEPYRIDGNAIEPIRPLGAGAYGTVWLATYLGETVVVKKLSPPLRPSTLTRTRSWRRTSRTSATAATRSSCTGPSPEQTALRRFVSEILFLATLSHPKIVAFYGAAWTVPLVTTNSKTHGHSATPPPNSDLQLVLEYMSRGDLRHYLSSTRMDARARAWNARKLTMALDVAEALAYLHSRQPEPVLHRDLKSRNILLDGSFTAKVADFGVSRYGLRARANTLIHPTEGQGGGQQQEKEDSLAMTRAVGTNRWIAPEVLAGEARYSAAVDVYSFGVILSELDSHELPFADVALSNGEPLPEAAVLELLRSGALQPSLSIRCPHDVAELMLECLTLEPTLRPTASRIAERLRVMLESERRVSDIGDDVRSGGFVGENSFLGLQTGDNFSTSSFASSSELSMERGFRYALLEERD